jgi:hypothetical protein
MRTRGSFSTTAAEPASNQDCRDGAVVPASQASAASRSVAVYAVDRDNAERLWELSEAAL